MKGRMQDATYPSVFLLKRVLEFLLWDLFPVPAQMFIKDLDCFLLAT